MAELQKFPLSKRLETVSTTVNRAVSSVKMTAAVRVDADDVLKAVDNAIGDTWRNSGLQSLSVADYARVQIMAQDGILEQIYDRAKSRAGSDLEKGKYLDKTIGKASKANRVCNYAISFAEKGNYPDTVHVELSKEQKTRIEEIFKSNVSEENILAVVKKHKLNKHANLRDYGNLDDIKKQGQGAVIADRLLEAFGKDGGVNIYDVVREVSRKEKLKSALGLEEKFLEIDSQKTTGAIEANKIPAGITMEGLLSLGLGVSPTNLVAGKKSSGLVPA